MNAGFNAFSLEHHYFSVLCLEHFVFYWDSNDSHWGDAGNHRVFNPLSPLLHPADSKKRFKPVWNLLLSGSTLARNDACYVRVSGYPSLVSVFYSELVIKNLD
jgi:hypothetical protein